MWRYILKRLLLMVPTLFGVATLVFLLLRVLPGDIVELKYAGTG
ncbi:MAG: ABC transporter permease, partial [Candidatus Binatia bacterium]